MIFPNTFDKLHIGPSGNPDNAPVNDGQPAVLEWISERGWGTIELAFVHQVYLKEKQAAEVAATSQRLGLPLSAHGSYYINLASLEKPKIGASRGRIVQGATRLAQKDVKVWLRPELTGKPTQHGDVAELIKVANAVETALPCIDWAHLYARNGGAFNSYDEWCGVLDQLAHGIRNKNVLQRMHMHFSGIEYGPRGERRHIPLATCELRYKELMQALKQAGVTGTLVVEAPRLSLEEDVDRLIDAWEAA
jgi:deoxyribonuclease-4